MAPQISRTAEIRKLAARDDGAAETALAGLLESLFGLAASNVVINRDQYSLNSMNGFFDVGSEQFFFKFHQEEGEEAMSGEYYRAEILAEAGLPIDMPLMKSTLPGEQILIYRRRSHPRFSDVLKGLDLNPTASGIEQAAQAETALSKGVLATYLKTLESITPTQSKAESIHRLFWERLVDLPGRRFPGGRLARFYVGQCFQFPGLELSWDELAKLRWRINGVSYRHSLAALFATAHQRMAPDCLADAGGVVAHGDAHNANVWFEDGGGEAKLTYFDPAFAGRHVPSLLAEIKTTFHNTLAHPLWLYDPAQFQAHFNVSATLEDGVLTVVTDWSMNEVRSRLLKIKALEVWRPLLAILRERGLLPSDWRTVIRLGLFLCPTLVMSLRAGADRHNPSSSLQGLAMAVLSGSPPVSGTDVVTAFLDEIDPELAPRACTTAGRRPV